MMNKANPGLYFGITVLLMLSLSGCVMQNPFNAVAPGIWRGKLYLDGKQRHVARDLLATDEHLQEQTDGVLFFNFTVEYIHADSFVVNIKNGDETVQPDRISWGRNPKTGRDTLRMDFLQYNTYILCMFEERVMEGAFYMPDRGPDYSIPFVAWYGRPYRFTALQKEPVTDISGTWDVTLGTDTEAPWKALGEFRQQNNQVYGTFLTATGDYRYLEGTIQENKVYLSRFDGAAAYLFEAVVVDRQTLLGSFRSGSHLRVVWEANRTTDAEAQLFTRPVNITDEAWQPLQYTTIEGSTINLEDERYRNRLKLIQIMGTWCSNCMDETLFLRNVLEDMPQDSLLWLSVAFERGDTTRAVSSIKRYRDRYGLNHPMIYGGNADKATAANMFPALDTVIAFPTMVILGKNNEILDIRSGFSGPATAGYTEYKKAFSAQLNYWINSGHHEQ